MAIFYIYIFFKNFQKNSLSGNPWHCDCQSVWLTKNKYFQDDSKSLQLSLPTCSSPPKFRRQPLSVFSGNCLLYTSDAADE